MHEFSISSEIVRTVLDTAKENNARKVLSVELEMGELTHISGEQVAFWIQELLRGSVAEGAKVKIRKLKARIQCNACHYVGRISSGQKPVQDPVFPCCPKCGSFDIGIQKGRECILKRIEAVK